MKVLDVFSNCSPTSPGVFRWVRVVGLYEEGWKKHRCTSPRRQSLSVSLLSCAKGKTEIHLASELWTGPFTTSKQLTLSLFYLLPLFAPKPGHLRQVRFSAHLLFQRVGRSQDQSVLESGL